MPPQSPPLGVPRERCPFSVRVGGVSIRVSRTSVAEYLVDRAHLTPDSDASRPRILFSCLCKLLGKVIFIKHRSLVERSVLPTRSESTTFIPSVMRKKVIIVDQGHRHIWHYPLSPGAIGTSGLPGAIGTYRLVHHHRLGVSAHPDLCRLSALHRIIH